MRACSLLPLATIACGTTTARDRPDAEEVRSASALPDGDVAPATSGSLTIATYNVAGLPEGLSSSHPATNTSLISPHLNAFDLVLVQEDFAYHAELVSRSTLAHVIAPGGRVSATDLGDGLAILSRFALGAATHVKWTACNGWFEAKNDCLTSKGFVQTSVELATGVVVDLYDLHADAGRASADAAARSQQMQQLVDYIGAHSAGRPVIVAGDTNMNGADEAELLELMNGAQLTDSCRALRCPETYRFDRVLFRDGAGVTFTPTSTAVDPTFVDPRGKQLSDHRPDVVGLSWTVAR
jgi:endonuclease/exonuclease/phosphatase (EEP) superfamily protein YafD